MTETPILIHMARNVTAAGIVIAVRMRNSGMTAAADTIMAISLMQINILHNN